MCVLGVCRARRRSLRINIHVTIANETRAALAPSALGGVHRLERRHEVGHEGCVEAVAGPEHRRDVVVARACRSRRRRGRREQDARERAARDVARVEHEECGRPEGTLRHGDYMAVTWRLARGARMSRARVAVTDGGLCEREKTRLRRAAPGVVWFRVRSRRRAGRRVFGRAAPVPIIIIITTACNKPNPTNRTREVTHRRSRASEGSRRPRRPRRRRRRARRRPRLLPRRISAAV